MTDPTGVCFISYRRTHAAEATRVVSALKDHGIPTWRDLDDLPHTQTESELRRVLQDDSTACAVLLITRDLATSPVIRETEVPLVVARVAAGDGFFVVPVLLDGIDYAEAASLFEGQIGANDLSTWNLWKVDAESIDVGVAPAIARRVLGQRIDAIHRSLDESDALRVRLDTRNPRSDEPAAALHIDWSPHFSGRHTTSQCWEETLLPALKAVASTIEARAANRSVECSGNLALPAAIALGTTFLAPRGINVVWSQHRAGDAVELWSLGSRQDTCSLAVKEIPQDPGAQDIALLVSVTDDVERDYAASSHLLPPMRVVVHVGNHSEKGLNRCTLNPGQAARAAHLIVDSVRGARTKYGASGTLHIFLAAPAGLAVMLGQLLNTFAAVQTYEHDPTAKPPYKQAVLLRPSTS